MAKPKENTERLNIFLPPSALEKIKQEAAERGINVSAVIRGIVLKYLRENEK